MRNTFVMIALALAAAATWLLTWQPAERRLPVEDAATSPTLGYYLRGARMIGTDAQGRVSYRIFAERLDELPDEGRLELTGVDVEYQPTDETPWAISAAKASATKDIERLDLTGGVEIRSAAADDSEPVTVVTQTLTFWPDTSNAESDGRVEIQVGNWRFSGEGLRADLKGDSLKLESDVHGTLVP